MLCASWKTFDSNTHVRLREPLVACGAGETTTSGRCRGGFELRGTGLHVERMSRCSCDMILCCAGWRWHQWHQSTNACCGVRLELERCNGGRWMGKLKTAYFRFLCVYFAMLLLLVVARCCFFDCCRDVAASDCCTVC